MTIKLPISFIAIICLLLQIATACSAADGLNQQYDPNKNYAAFLILDSENGMSILQQIKDRSTAEGYEIGPIVYYKLGRKDFEPLVKKLIPGSHIKLVWIASSLMDVPDIQKALSAAGYKGMIRYMPATATPAQ